MFIRIIKFSKEIKGGMLLESDFNKYIDRVDILKDNILKSSGFDNGAFVISLKNDVVIGNIDLFEYCEYIQGVIDDTEVRVNFKKNNITPVTAKNKIILNIKNTEIVKDMLIYNKIE